MFLCDHAWSHLEDLPNNRDIIATVNIAKHREYCFPQIIDQFRFSIDTSNFLISLLLNIFCFRMIMLILTSPQHVFVDLED